MSTVVCTVQRRADHASAGSAATGALGFRARAAGVDRRTLSNDEPGRHRLPLRPGDSTRDDLISCSVGRCRADRAGTCRASFGPRAAERVRGCDEVKGCDQTVSPSTACTTFM